ncbi:MAG: acetolactate synthase small subunit [Oscillospiraceae bacterium]|nr:acetolactate synthase small subunit [Oscillospiraceae bacterium]
MKFTVVLSVHNRYGVLNRITGVYARRGYNIDSLSMETSNPEVYRITICSKGDDYAQMQVTRQLAKLHDVVEVELI